MTTTEQNANQKKKVMALVGIVAFGGLAGGYFYYAEEAKKAERAAKLQQLIGAQATMTTDTSASSTTMTTNNVPLPPEKVDTAPLTKGLEHLLALGERKAVAQATLQALKAETEAKEEENKLLSVGKPPVNAPDQSPGGFTLAGEMPSGINLAPVGTGITFNEPVKEPVLASLDKLTLRYTARVDGKVTAYVSMGDNGSLVSVRPGSTVEGVRITLVDEDQICATQNKASRCLTMTY